MPGESPEACRLIYSHFFPKKKKHPYVGYCYGVVSTTLPRTSVSASVGGDGSDASPGQHGMFIFGAKHLLEDAVKAMTEPESGASGMKVSIVLLFLTRNS